jgi:alginate O-acetyltransferase complex protein AlgI
MSFISFSFLALFLATLAARLTIGRQKKEIPYLIALLAASLFFYLSYIPAYIFILLAITLVDYFLGHKIAASENQNHRKLYLTASIVSNLGLLAYFKYFNFFIQSLGTVLGWLNFPASLQARVDWALPLGISFFTFQSMSYTIDIYRRQLEPVRSYWRFLLFVSFFTHLVSGPIVRARELIYQFDRRRLLRLKVFLQGVYLMILGFFLKMVVADQLAFHVNRYWAGGAIVKKSAAVPLTLAFLFSCQIFSDFAGYSNIAIGSAYILGFKLPRNFNNPYIAGSFREFWSRWHITLSHWIRDYLYLPLGGNRLSKARTMVNLLVVMLLAGLWHGAAFTFIVWGALHGMALLIERLLGLHQPAEKRPWWVSFIWFGVVQGLVLVAWVFFRSQDCDEALGFLKNIFCFHWGWGNTKKIGPPLIFTVPVILMHLRGFLQDRKILEVPGTLEKSFLSGIMLYGVLTLYGDKNVFIYFNF